LSNRGTVWSLSGGDSRFPLHVGIYLPNKALSGYPESDTDSPETLIPVCQKRAISNYPIFDGGSRFPQHIGIYLPYKALPGYLQSDRETRCLETMISISQKGHFPVTLHQMETEISPDMLLPMYQMNALSLCPVSEYSMLIFISINLYNCSCDYLYSFCVVCPLLCA
jgi:hypothetical protein